MTSIVLEYLGLSDYHGVNLTTETEGGFMEGESTTEKLMTDLKALIGDAEELLKATTNQAGERIAVARQRIEQSLVEGKRALADAEQIVLDKSKEYADTADDYVRENPWAAVGIAAGVGLIFGLLMRRS
jgi:ElaB/YqjD/DUF883 family membrane-anchored ribosome-binding protein